MVERAFDNAYQDASAPSAPTGFAHDRFPTPDSRLPIHHHPMCMNQIAAIASNTITSEMA